MGKKSKNTTSKKVAVTKKTQNVKHVRAGLGGSSSKNSGSSSNNVKTTTPNVSKEKQQQLFAIYKFLEQLECSTFLNQTLATFKEEWKRNFGQELRDNGNSENSITEMGVANTFENRMWVNLIF